MKIRQVLALDVGSTTTKGRMFIRDDKWKVAGSADRPTTVEAPEEDVMVGVLAVCRALEADLGIQIIFEDGSLRAGDEGAVVACSSAGGGLRMVVGGVVREMTAESAERAALGAGAIVQDVFSVNDGRFPVERVARIRSLRPDMILFTGGTDGGQVSHVIALAEWIRAAEPEPRYGKGQNLPVIYAGNASARSLVTEILGDRVDLHSVDNLRPRLEVEVLGPARDAIHDVFMEHVMAQAPGYEKLLSIVDAQVLPTPGAFGRLVRELVGEVGGDVLAVDVGGATTDIFSVVSGELYRTVSANLGMSYSAANVFASTIPEDIARWLPEPLSTDDIREWTANKMIRPTTLPHLLSDLQMEHALVREAIRLALEHHNRLVVTLKGVEAEGGRTPLLTAHGDPTGQKMVDMMKVEEIVGSGGVLSHAGRLSQVLAIMIDGFAPEGLTRLRVDRGFVIPHLGVLTQLDPGAARQLTDQVLAEAGWCLAPVVPGGARPPAVLAEVEIVRRGKREQVRLKPGGFEVRPLDQTSSVTLSCAPARGVDAGAGPGRHLRVSIPPSPGQLVLDGRGRPLPGTAELSLEQLIAQTRRNLAKLGCYSDEEAMT